MLISYFCYGAHTADARPLLGYIWSRLTPDDRKLYGDRYGRIELSSSSGGLKKLITLDIEDPVDREHFLQNLVAGEGVAELIRRHLGAQFGFITNSDYSLRKVSGVLYHKGLYWKTTEESKEVVLPLVSEALLMQQLEIARMVNAINSTGDQTFPSPAGWRIGVVDV